MGLAVAILAVRGAVKIKKGEKQDSNYGLEGMCLGMCFGTALGTALGNNTGTLTVKAVFDNPDGLLLPGMFARVKLSGAVQPNAMLVPQRAVQQLLGKTFVMVADADGKSEARTVTLGEKVGSYYIVKDGLSPEDLVVVEGLSNLQEGVPLSVTMVTADDMGFSLDEDTTKFDDSTVVSNE